MLVPNVTGLNLADATSALKKNNLTLRTVGDGDTVTGQIPAPGASIPGGSQVVLYMGEEVPTDQVEVPNVVGPHPGAGPDRSWRTPGLYLKAIGAADYSCQHRLRAVHRRRHHGGPGHRHRGALQRHHGQRRQAPACIKKR